MLKIPSLKNYFKSKRTPDISPYQDFRIRELILRDYLAIDRTILAGENTFLSYIRTSLTVLAIGATVIHFFNSLFTQILGVVTIIASVLISAFGYKKNTKLRARMKSLQMGIVSPTIINPLDRQTHQKQ